MKKNNLLKGSFKDNFYENFGSASINFLYKGCVFNNIFLVSEASGLVFRLTGEGILPALISGKEVARKIFDVNYNMPELKEILKIKKKQEIYKKVLDFIASTKNKSVIERFINMYKRKNFQLDFFGKKQ